MYFNVGIKSSCHLALLIFPLHFSRDTSIRFVVQLVSQTWLSLCIFLLVAFILSFFLTPEVVEHACSITSLMLGETLPSITKDMDTYTYRLPIGVCAGIAPFNFPAMIPLWMFPVGMVCGNTYLMKPSERVPGCTMLLAKMLQDAGAPDGTLNIIHGQHAGEFLHAHVCPPAHSKARDLCVINGGERSEDDSNTDHIPSGNM